MPGTDARLLPYVDALVSGDSLAALSEVADAIGAEPGELEPPEAAIDDDDGEPWASAMPVPGSSVAMPSGYSPKRGQTTPGWSPLR